MSLRKSSDVPGVPASAASRRKDKPDIYTVFLTVALVAVLVAMLFLYFEMRAYEFKLKGAPAMVRLDGPGFPADRPALAQGSLRFYS